MLLELDPVPQLLRRIRAELAADFAPGRPIRVSRAPGRIDVMGGIADYTGSLVCEATLDRAAALAMQTREDRNLQVFSFNLLDENQPFTLRIPLDALADASADSLRADFAEPSRRWAAYLAGCLFLLHEQAFINLRDPAIPGLSLALLSTIPLSVGVSSSAAIEVVTMINLADHFNLRPEPLNPMALASLCQQVENRIVGAPCGIMDQVTSIAGQPGALLRLLCQPHELQSPLHLPAGVRVLGINSGIQHSVGGNAYARTRCAAFMGHRIILDIMRRKGQELGMVLATDPMAGYLANLDPDDYKSLFRPLLPESITGQAFLDQYGPTIDKATTVQPDGSYHVRAATDHHVFEARRVRQFVDFIESAAPLSIATRECGLLLDKAGHLMYASHESYGKNARLGSPECDLLVSLLRKEEPAGIYGAKITGGGSGGTVAVLANASPRVDEAISRVMAEYERQTHHRPEAFLHSSPGAWSTSTKIVSG